MPTTLTEIAEEESTYLITFAFTDEDGNSVVPAAIVWSLTDDTGNIINSLTDQIEPNASSVTIVLTGDDLQVTAAETALARVGNRTTVRRHLVVEATYDSVTYGNGLGLNGEAVFELENLKKVA